MPVSGPCDFTNHTTSYNSPWLAEKIILLVDSASDEVRDQTVQKSGSADPKWRYSTPHLHNCSIRSVLQNRATITKAIT